MDVNKELNIICACCYKTSARNFLICIICKSSLCWDCIAIQLPVNEDNETVGECKDCNNLRKISIKYYKETVEGIIRDKYITDIADEIIRYVKF